MSSSKSARGFYAATAVAVVLAALALPVHAESEGVLKVQLWDKPDGTQGIAVSSEQLKPGPMRLEVTNASAVKQDHELLLAKSELTADQLPFKDSGNKVDEEKIAGVTELGDIEPGETKQFTMNFEPGRYILFCNEQGHVKAGMLKAVLITQ